MILTDTGTDPWNDASTGTLSVRRCVLQKVGGWRADVVATTRDDGLPHEYIRYSPYGIPTSYPAMDANRDMVTNSTDETDWLTVFSGGSANIVIGIDTNKDGLVPDTGDFDYMADEAADTAKRGGYNKAGTATSTVAPLRFAYAGYAWDPAIKMYHVRHRVYSADMGRWLTRDPIEYSGGSPNLMQYVGGEPLRESDPMGLVPIGCSICDFDRGWFGISCEIDDPTSVLLPSRFGLPKWYYKPPAGVGCCCASTWLQAATTGYPRINCGALWNSPVNRPACINVDHCIPPLVCRGSDADWWTCTVTTSMSATFTGCNCRPGGPTACTYTWKLANLSAVQCSTGILDVCIRSDCDLSCGPRWLAAFASCCSLLLVGVHTLYLATADV